MVVVYHQNNRITKISTPTNEIISGNAYISIASGIMTLAQKFPKEKIVWCHEKLQDAINFDGINTLFHHDKLMLSFTFDENGYLGKKIGFVEESPFINVNKKVSYPTWLMSSDVGVIHASVLNLVEGKIKLDAHFDYYLNSVAKVCMFLGLLCYSEPQLLLKNVGCATSKKANVYELFRFVKQHYKNRWTVLLLLNMLVFEKRFPLLPFIYAQFFKSRKQTDLCLDSILIQSTLRKVEQQTIDVVIPTIGRKKYLYDVLQDLSKQTHLPVHVIIVEQNPNPESSSELDFLTSQAWPFNIKHTFTHQAGACHARNLALRQVESEWVFLADDDIGFDTLFFSNTLCKIEQFGIEVITTSCLQLNESQRYTITNQSGIFGSGNSLVKTSCLTTIRFDTALEFGYGEDIDFGLQLRNQGFDILYLPEIRIVHLKAPMGGFRIKVKQVWEDEIIPPKPSPTVMYVFLKYYTREQLLCYKLVSFFKLIKKVSVFNYIDFLKFFNKKWDSSLYWANRIKEKNENKY